MKFRLSSTALVFMALTMLSCSKAPAAQPATLSMRIDNTNGSEHHRMQSEMRDFLWEHWHAKQPAILQLTSISKEGKQVDVRFEIKNAPPAPLVLQIDATGYRYGYNGQVFRGEETRNEVYTIDRVLFDRCFLLRADSHAQVLPHDSNQPASEYCLRFRRWGDEFEGSF